MIDLSTVVGAKAATAIEINGLLIPANSFSHHIVKYSEPGLFHTDGMGPYHLTKSGSLTKVCYKNRYFTIMTSHQFGGESSRYDYSQACLHNAETGRIITAERVVFQTNPDERNLDCVVCEYTAPVLAGALPTHGWYRVDRSVSTNLPKPTVVCAIGYPGHRNSFDFDANVYDVAPNAVFGSETKPSLSNRLAFKPIEDTPYEPFGMSGGPVFGVELEDLKPKAFFAGIITNASEKKFHFLSRRFISDYLP